MIDFLAGGGNKSPALDYMLTKAADYTTKDKTTIDEKGIHFHGESPEKVGEGGGGKAAQPTASTKPEAGTPGIGFGPALAALAAAPSGGASAATLTGLTPEQISSLLGRESEIARLRQGTIGQLLEFPYRRALTEKALRPETPEVPLNLRIAATEALIAQRLREPTKPRTLEEAKELKVAPGPPPEITTYDWWMNPTTQDVQPVRKDKAPPPGYTKRVPSREIEVSDLPERRLSYEKMKTSGRVREIILKEPGANENEGRIAEANEGSMEPTLFIWTKSWMGDNAEVIDLPEGMVADNFPADLVTRLGRGETVSMRNPKTKKVVRFKIVGNEVKIVK